MFKLWIMVLNYNVKKYSDIDIRDIISRINKLSQKEKNHILNILRTTKIKYTKNSNGFFFNLLDIDENVLDKIFDCINMIEKNADILKELDRRRSELLEYYRNIIESRLKDKLMVSKMEYLNKLKIYDDNITIKIKRKDKIKRIMMFDPMQDIDVVIKEYNKSKQRYEKGSVYYRINSNLKSYRRTFDKSKQNDYEDIQYELPDELTNEDLADEIINDIEEDIDIDQSIDDLSDDINENDKNDFDSTSEEYIQDIDDFEDQEDRENVVENNNMKKDKINKEFLFIKNLLYKKGFEFNDNKNCMLIYESYIN